MRRRVIDLDGALVAQSDFLKGLNPEVVDLSSWGPWVRLACRFDTFRRFEQQLGKLIGACRQPALTFLGSGDFHHVTLALLRRIEQPFNLLVIDKHPDWMRAIPIMHCGTWLWHALKLPNLKRVFHVGGDLDFDNHYRRLAPWRHLHSGRVTVIPASRCYQRGSWPSIPHRPLLEPSGSETVTQALERALRPMLDDLRRDPLYITLDKDVLSAAEAVVNWDSGMLSFGDVRAVIDWFQAACGGRLAGMDVVGDWSPVRMHWGLRTLCHWTEHPSLNVTPEVATRINQSLNMAIVRHVLRRAESVPAASPVQETADLVPAR
jgi:hypothetical protein